MTRKELHDRLLAMKPEGADHDPESCDLCVDSNAVVDPTSASAKEDAVSEITKEQLDAAVVAAREESAGRIAELEARVVSFEESQREGAIEAAVAEAKAEAQAEIDELKTQLDAAVLEASTTKEAFDAFKSELTELETQRTEAEEAAARKDERLTKVAEVASFPQEHIDANAERWAAMSDEAFEQQLEDWRQIAAKGAGEHIPNTTGMHASRETTSTAGAGTALKAVFDLMRDGVDTRD